MKTVVLMFAVLATVGSLQAQNLLANGSFESGTNGWTIGGPATAVKILNNHGADAGTYAAVFDAGSAPTGGTLAQTVTTVPGDTYTLTFFYSGYSTAVSPSTQTLGVEIETSGLVNIATNSYNPAGTYANPATFSVANKITEVFQATTTSTELVFTDNTLNGGKSDGVLDNVSLTLTAVPEPSTLAMSAVGGLFSVLALRRRK